MAGILDSKSRIMDVVITEQGRRQLASGQMKIEFATFTDIGSFYQASGSILDDPGNRIYFEAAGDLPSDMITFETDDSGLLIPYRSDGLVAAGTNLILSSSTTSDPANIDSVTQAVFDSWQQLQVIGTDDPLDDNQEFKLSRTSATFSIRDDFPFDESDVQEACVDDIESLFNDFRLSHLDNFKYLPPVNARGVLAGKTIGDYRDSNEKLDNDINNFEKRISSLEHIDFEFINTSLENNFIMQMFEMSGDAGLIKLDVIDYGERKSSSDKTKNVRTLFAGKILKDGYGNPTFINIFTIELES
jgi:hypothetical protein